MSSNAQRVVVTAYCPCAQCCGPNATGLTASGRPAIAGRTLAATREVALGTRLQLFNKWYVVEDRMSRRYRSGRLDIFMRTHEEARRFGRKVLWLSPQSASRQLNRPTGQSGSSKPSGR